MKITTHCKQSKRGWWFSISTKLSRMLMFLLAGLPLMARNRALLYRGSAWNEIPMQRHVLLVARNSLKTRHCFRMFHTKIWTLNYSGKTVHPVYIKTFVKYNSNIVKVTVVSWIISILLCDLTDLAGFSSTEVRPVCMINIWIKILCVAFLGQCYLEFEPWIIIIKAKLYVLYLDTSKDKPNSLKVIW